MRRFWLQKQGRGVPEAELDRAELLPGPEPGPGGGGWGVGLPLLQATALLLLY